MTMGIGLEKYEESNNRFRVSSMNTLRQYLRQINAVLIIFQPDSSKYVTIISRAKMMYERVETEIRKRLMEKNNEKSDR